MSAGDSVVIAPYSPAWPHVYARARDAIVAALGDLLVGIEHVGSTAVPGLGAKPVIDIMPGVAHDTALGRCIAPLQGLGYEYVPAFEDEMPFRRYFRKPATAQEHAIHVHVVVVGDAFWDDHLLFRDYLRRHPAVVAQYEQLKRTIARTATDGEAYQDAKAAFIASVMREAYGSL